MAKKIMTLKEQGDYLRRVSEFDRKNTNPTDLNTNYYNLQKRIVSQAINDFYRKFPNILGIMPWEDWVNGLKEEFKISLLDTKDFDPNVTLDDFNAQDPIVKSDTFGIDKKKYLSFRIPALDLIDFFTNDAKLVNWVQSIIARAKQTLEFMVFNDTSATLLQTADKVIPITFDKTIDTSGMDTQGVLEAMRLYVYSLQIPSETHITKPAGLTDKQFEKFKYSAQPENLMIIYNSKFFAGDVAKLTATLYNKDDVMVKLDKKILDFSMIKGADKTDTDKIKAFIIDKKSFAVGFEVKEINRQYQVVKFQMLHEYLTFYGFARRWEYAIAVFKDTTSRASKIKSGGKISPP